MFDDDLLADLPTPRDDEPPSLRADIADELADHLRCALRREVFKDGNETAAQQRVLERFGDPKKLARRLWWQAMWSLIMRQRILSGMQWLVSLSAVVLAGAVFWQQSQMWQEMRTARQEEAVQRQALTTALNQLQAAYGTPATVPDEVGMRVAENKRSYSGPPPDSQLDSGDVAGEPPFDPPGDDQDRSSLKRVPDEDLAYPVAKDRPSESQGDVGLPPSYYPPADDGSPPVLAVKFVLQEADGPAIFPQGLDLLAHDGSHIEHETSDRTVAVPLTLYRSLRPGRYELNMTLADGQTATRPVLIRDQKPQELTVICPSARPGASVLVTMPPLPKDLWEAADRWDYRIAPQPVLLDGVAWEPPPTNSQTLSFDPKTGKAISLSESGNSTDLHNAKAEDCVLFLPEGPVGTVFCLTLRQTKANTRDEYGHVVQYPPPNSPQGRITFLPRTVEPGENRWTIELPEEFLKQARESLEQLKSFNNDPYAAMPAAAPAVASPTESATPPQLTLKLVQEKEDGPPANVYSVGITGRRSQELADQQGSADGRRFVFQTLAPDHYRLTVYLKDGQECTRPLLIRDDKPQELTILCPGPRKEVPVSITVPPLPEALQKRKFRVSVEIHADPVEIGQIKWTASGLTSQVVTFDRATGLPTAIEMWSERSQERFDLSELPADQRSVFLSIGTVNYSFSAAEVLEGPGSVPVYEWPKNAEEAAGWLKQTISADQKTWKLELPQAYLDEILGDVTAGSEVQ